MNGGGSIEDITTTFVGAAGLILPLFFLPQAITNSAIFATLMLVWALGATGYILRFYVHPKIVHDENLTSEELVTSVKWSILALAVFSFASALIPLIPFTLSQFFLELTPNDQLLFGVMFSINEESLFRGGLLELGYWKLPKSQVGQLMASVWSGLWFYVFHVYVYGTVSDSIAFVMVAGFMLGYVTLASKRLLPAYLAHIINNVLVVLG